MLRGPLHFIVACKVYSRRSREVTLGTRITRLNLLMIVSEQAAHGQFAYISLTHRLNALTTALVKPKAGLTKVALGTK
jgi:hypothetical protein